MSYGGEDRSSVVNGVNWALTSGSIAVVALRMVSRGSTRNFGFDDLLVVPAIIIQIAYVSVLSEAVSYGYGKHLKAIDPSKATTALYYATVAQCLAVLTFALPKLAIVALLERLLSLQLCTRVIFWAMALSLLIFCLALSASWYSQCTPRAHQWDLNIQGTCWDPSVLLNYSYFIGAFSAFLDLFWAIFPPFVVAKLRMPLYKKIAISGALGGGVLACGVTVYKCTLLLELGQDARVDPTWADVPLLVWTAVETNVLIMAASLPTVGPFFRFIRERSVNLYKGSTPTSKRYVRDETDWGNKPRGKKKHALTLTGGTTSGLYRLSSDQEDDIHLVDVENSAQIKPSNESSPAPPAKVAENPRSLEIAKHVGMQTIAREARPSDRTSNTYRFNILTQGNVAGEGQLEK